MLTFIPHFTNRSVLGCSKVFNNTVEEFQTYLGAEGLDEFVCQVCPVTFTETPIPSPSISRARSMTHPRTIRGLEEYNSNSNSNFGLPSGVTCYEQRALPVPTSLPSSCSASALLPMTAAQFVKSCSSLIQWARNDTTQGLPAILSSMPGLWSDFAYHYNNAAQTSTEAGAGAEMDAETTVSLEAAREMEASMRALLGTLCGIVIQSANLISDNHVDRLVVVYRVISFVSLVSPSEKLLQGL